jgi:hypothetical protein
MESGAYRAIHRSACVLAPRADSLVDVVLSEVGLQSVSWAHATIRVLFFRP